ncbi:hypothetical protein EVAR_63863_1 [Eumeta japonica]|uniref:Uncharacterized protein n=1 Tax=Eumeta variegata TaxID=151549 RepID=A0A4C2A5S2_EUMVA|nr:hypothetical protein EVAR_63863_1 [Eumeta japonica]
MNYFISHNAPSLTQDSGRNPVFASDSGPAFDSGPGLGLRRFRLHYRPRPSLRSGLSGASHSYCGHDLDSHFDPAFDFDLSVILDFDAGFGRPTTLFLVPCAISIPLEVTVLIWKKT